MNNLSELFFNRAEQFANRPLVHEKLSNNYSFITYSEAAIKVKELSNAFRNANFRKGDKIALMSEGRSWWLFSELAMFDAGLISVPLSIKLDEPEDLVFRISHSECSAIVLSARMLERIRRIRSRLEKIEMLIVLDLPAYGDIPNLMDGEILLSTFLDQYKNDQNGNPEEVPHNPDDIANICYTSGTTADPKGILLSHGNYLENIDQATSMIDVTPDFVTLLILPWDHSFAHTVGLYSLINQGASIACVDAGKSGMDTLRNIPLNIKEVKPYFLLSVPSLAKNFRANIEKSIGESGKIAGFLFKSGLKAGYFYNRNGFDKGKKASFLVYPYYKLIDFIVFRKIRAAFGGRLRFFVGGGALLDSEIQRFFMAIGMPMLQGYGLSEAAPVISTNTLENIKIGSSGKIVPDLEIRILDSEGRALSDQEAGEIVIRGKNVMRGYWKNESASMETLRNGWLFTGDIGYIDREGYLFVKGRYKSLLIGADGEKYSPEGIEEKILELCPFISQIIIFNNQNPYTIALIVPDSKKMANLAKEMEVNVDDDQSIGLFIKTIHKQIVNCGTEDGNIVFPERWMPSTFAILEEPFTEHNKMINSTLKMVRGKIHEAYSDRINSLYKLETKLPDNAVNIAIVKKYLNIHNVES